MKDVAPINQTEQAYRNLNTVACNRAAIAFGNIAWHCNAEGIVRYRPNKKVTTDEVGLILPLPTDGVSGPAFAALDFDLGNLELVQRSVIEMTSEVMPVFVTQHPQ